MIKENSNLILIVDDNPMNVQVLAAVLTDCGYQTGVAMSGKQALEFLEENIPDLILLDVMMPEMDGFEVCERIKENPKQKEIPIIFLTAKSEKEDIIRGFKSGGVDYIVKPFNNAELKARVSTHMELKQNRDALLNLNEEIRTMNDELDKKVQERTLKLQMLNDQQTAFSYAIAHDLRSPLRAMNGYSQFMLDDYGDKLDEHGKDLLKKIHDNTTRIGDLIDHLLAYSRLNRTEISRRIINMNELVKEVVSSFEKEEKHKSVRFDLGVLSNVYADRDMVWQLMFQLVSNAIKFSSRTENPVVRIDQRIEEAETIFFVQDNGAGFNMDFYGKLFGVFQRLHGINEFKGYGIGLTYVKAIVEKHNGRIWAESKVDQGATFYFTIP